MRSFLSRTPSSARLRRGSYKSRKREDEVEDDMLAGLSQRLAEDLREQIKEISASELFSEKWMSLTTALTRLAIVVETEGEMEEESKSETLWEGEEHALRFLLEDGKVNVLVRLLETFKEEQRKMLQNSTWFATSDKGIAAIATRFEEAICKILRFSLGHPEVMDTIDISVVFDLLVKSFEFSTFHSGSFTAPLDGMLELEGFHFLKNIVQHAERTGKSELFLPIREKGIFGLCLSSLTANIQSFHSQASQFAILASMSAMIDTEDFDTYEPEYLSNSTHVRDLLGLQEMTVLHLQNSTPEERKVIRPLADEIKRHSRKSKK